MHAPESAPTADGADSLVFARAVPREPVVLHATTQPIPADQGTEGGLSRVASYRWRLTIVRRQNRRVTIKRDEIVQ